MGNYWANSEVKNEEKKDRPQFELKVPPRSFSRLFNFDCPEDLSGIEEVNNYGILPSGTLLKIFNFCRLSSLLQCSCSCQLFHRMIQNQIFWKQYYLNFHPSIVSQSSQNEHKVINWKEKVFFTFCSFKAKNEFYKRNFFRNENSHSFPNNGVPYNYLFKFLYVGDHGVGKTCLMLRFADGKFSDSYLATIGVEFSHCRAGYGDNTFKLQIWETAGEERFRSITRAYYRGAFGILACFSLNDENSFKNVDTWIDEVRKNAHKDTQIVVIGMKCDLERKVSKEMVIQLLKRKGMSFEEDYCECSAKENLYCELPFGILLEKTMRRASEGGFEDLMQYSKK